ncbi:MAG: DnaB-like helicase N-terminal domain-containing protein, partial [Candidatus Thorarchaeota archaeon]
MLEAVGAERALLAIIMKKPDSVFIADEILDESDFTNSGNGLIYSLMKDIVFEDSEAALDRFILISRAQEKGIQDFFKLTQQGELLEALEQTKKSINESSINKYIAAIKKATVKRTLLYTIDDVKNDIETYDGGIVELRNFVEDTILGTMRDIDSGEQDIVNL